jgi:hypothetical protein
MDHCKNDRWVGKTQADPRCKAYPSGIYEHSDQVSPISNGKHQQNRWCEKDLPPENDLPFVSRFDASQHEPVN